MRYRSRTNGSTWRLPITALTALGLVGAAAAIPSAPASASTPAIPSAAFQDHTGITSTTVTVGNVSTQTGGLFSGALVGTKAYADYINSTGGVNGRKIVVDGADDGYNDGANNKALTKADIGSDFAMVGSFSLNDAYGGAVLKADPSVPNVTVSLDEATNQLPNTFSPQPANDGWELGPLVYFQKKYPTDVTHAGALVAGEPSAEAAFAGEKAAMLHLGYKVVYDPTFLITQTDFTQNVITMRNDGVKILFIEQMPENYASAVFKALDAQDFHPVVVLGASTYSNALVAASWGASATDGAYLEQAASLYLGEDASAIPAVTTFQDWVQKASPGFKPDLYTLYGWVSAELFADALQKAGKDPSRGSELQALRSITSYSGNNLLAPADPAAKTPAECYIIAKIVNGVFTRTDDTPLNGPNHGYRCDQPYYSSSGKTES
jgi:ABC-type branched-subunit amino acid transport system substrate-binding protein